MQAVPVAQHNAIEASIFTLRLSYPADAEAELRLDKALTAANLMPGREQGQSITIQMGAAPTSPPARLTRFEARPNGSYAWGLQLHGPFLTVACHDYTRFDTVWQRAKRILMLSLQHIGESYSIAEVTHQVVDRFIYAVPAGGNAQDLYQMDQVFRRDTPYLTRKAWDSGLLWHVHQGWFESAEDDLRHLHQINISNSELQPQAQYATIIDHRGAARPTDAQAMLPRTAEFMDQTFCNLHRRNLALMRELLSDNMQTTINLREQA